MKKILILILAFATGLAVLNFLPVHGEEKIYDSVVRLHVIAASDSDEDQALKLKVRDALLEVFPEIIGGAADREEAERKITENLRTLERVAEKVISENGFEYSVELTLGREKYPTRSYDDCCFPAGEYSSLRVKIGAAEGKNWWCVLFPSLCLSASKAETERSFVEVGLTPEQYRIITDTEGAKYKLRFKILETLENAIG